jgi:pimeloyl-ACP methyl ester carboxylesterase
MAVAIARPKLEGTIAVGDDRQIGFAEFGDPQGRAVFWLHGTPGARRQIPVEARVYAEQRQIRLIGVDRPGIGSSTPYQYDTIRPVAEPALYAYAAISPAADRQLLVRPEFRAMFLDDLLNGSRKQLAAPFADVVVFARDWGFRLDEVKVPVRWWHGDRDHIVPFEHGQHVVSRLPDAQLTHLPGESHLAGLGRAEEILDSMLGLWDRIDQK